MSLFLKRVWGRTNLSSSVAPSLAALSLATLGVACGNSDDATELGVTPQDLENRVPARACRYRRGARRSGLTRGQPLYRYV
jgi:hypothetical protein